MPAITLTIPTLTLTVLKFAFLALLYLFVYRVAKAVVVDFRAARATAPQGAAAPSSPSPAPVRRKGRAPEQILVLDDRGRKLRALKLLGTVQIGRADACHLKLPDTYVSQFHARIYPQDGSWFVEDLGSTNGTFLNERKVAAPSEVRAGDRVRVGTTTMELK